MPEQHYFYGTGRRKTAVARVRLYPGNGAVVINGRPMEEVALVPGIYWPPRVREEAPDGVYGLAHEGTAEKGERLLAAVVERLTELLRGRLA